MDPVATFGRRECRAECWNLDPAWRNSRVGESIFFGASRGKKIPGVLWAHFLPPLPRALEGRENAEPKCKKWFRANRKQE